MANKYAGTQTEKNLEAAFAGESQARNKYTYFASRAKKDGFEQMAAIFLQTADNEKEHAKMWYKELHDGTLQRRLMRRALQNSQRSSVSLLLSRSITRSVIVLFLRTLRRLRYSRNQRLRYGSAVTVVI